MVRRGRWPMLDGLRGVVVLAIVGYHALRLVLLRDGGSWGDVDPWWWWVGTARLGVDVFFVLAGFLVIASWRSCRSAARGPVGACAEFAHRRAWRILPPYLVMLAVIVPLATPHLLHPTGWGDLARLVTLQQYLDPSLTAAVNVPIWSLTTEVHFYLVAPLLAWALHRRGGWLLVLPALALAVWWGATDARGDLAASLLPGRLHQFLLGAATGAAIARASAEGPTPLARLLCHPRALPALLAGLLVVGTYHGATYQTGATGLLPLLVHPTAGLLVAGLLVRLTCGPDVALANHSALRWFGRISFSLYLWHYPILDHGLSGLASRTPGGVTALAALALVGVSIAAAAASERWIERPAVQRKQRQAHQPEQPSTPTRTPISTAA